jgi:uncharacterized protein (DUF433 family)
VLAQAGDDIGLTTTVRGGKYSITTTRVPVEMVSLVSAA